MSVPEKSLQDFLQRWSRRKLGLEERPGERPQARAEQTKSADSRESNAPNPPSDESGASGDSAAEPFDLARLPPIESINASTDIRAFLARGVPTELTHAALRRAWLSDPAIRDFVGIAENQWDFTKPDTVPGFGSLELTAQLRRMVGELVGRLDTPSDAQASGANPAPRGLAALAKTPASDSVATAAPERATAGSVAAFPKAPRQPGGRDVATQNSEREEPPPAKSKHGGAMPR